MTIFASLMLSCNKKSEIQANNCNADVSREISFNKEIMPLISRNCLQCHDSKNHYDGLVFEKYEQIASSAKSGELYDSVISINGYAPKMPKGGKLTDCETNLIKFWIQQGVKNN
ncbi:hypothetical protein [Emticicia aquatilis]|nr:hypothetical protein [Emticicia aquatilis]